MLADSTKLNPVSRTLIRILGDYASGHLKNKDTIGYNRLRLESKQYARVDLASVPCGYKYKVKSPEY
jgi:hypothetical protein